MPTKPQEIPDAFTELCNCLTWEELEQELWNWLVVALATDNLTYDSGQKRSNLIFLHQKLKAACKEIYKCTSDN